MVAAHANAMRVMAVDASAALAGIQPGRTLADARALEPALNAVTADPAGDRRDVARLAAWCGRYTPWTAVEPEDADGGSCAGIWLDISGCAHLFGGEELLLDDLRGRLDELGFDCRAAIADTPGAAWAVARYGAGAATVVAPGDQQGVLGPLPPAALRLPAAVVDRLTRLGLRRIDELLVLPRAGLTARFGTGVARRLDQALGQQAEPISPQQPPPRLTAHMSFAEPIGRPEDIAAAARQLLDDVTAQLAAAEAGARLLRLSLFRCNGNVQPVEVGTSRPSRDPKHLERLFGEQLARLPEMPPHEAADGLVDVVRLEVLRSDTLKGQQQSLGRGLLGKGGADGARDDLAPLVDRLVNRLGAANVLQLHARQSHLPERAQVARAALDAADETPEDPSVRPQRPVRLLPRPEEIMAVAPVPDDPPVLFRWRGQTVRITRADGPERVAPEWWRAAGMLGHETRDYYRVEDGNGRRYWVFRRGLYTDVTETPPQWFLHGFFG